MAQLLYMSWEEALRVANREAKRHRVRLRLYKWGPNEWVICPARWPWRLR